MFERGVWRRNCGVQDLPLRLSLSYQSNVHHNITSCAFSKCGKYFAFPDRPSCVLGFSVSALVSSAFSHTDINCTHLESDPLNPEDIPIQYDAACSNATSGTWRIITSELLSGDSIPLPINPLFQIEASGPVSQIAFATGNSSYCRLPHRAQKRKSSVVRDSEVLLILLGLRTGVIEVYNVCDLLSQVSCIPKCVLIDEHSTVFLLSVAPDESLRLASVHERGQVRLWDLWDDGNMYGNPVHRFVLPTPKNSSPNSALQEKIYGQACTFAWQPGGNHICMAGEKGNAVILQSEAPFSLVATIRSGHLHRISSAAYTRDGSLLLTASYDSSCAVWSVPEYTCLHHYWHMGRVPSILLLGGSNGHHLYGLAISPDDAHFATICEDRCVRLWPLTPVTSPTKTYFELALSSPPGLKLRSVAFSPCGRLISVTTSDHRVLLFTTPSELLSLSSQCLRVLRHTITNKLTKTVATPIESGTTKEKENSLVLNSLFSQAVSHLPLPQQFLVAVFRDFWNESRT